MDQTSPVLWIKLSSVGLSSFPPLPIPKSSSNTSSWHLSPKGSKEHRVDIPWLTAWKGCSSDPGATGHVEKCIRLQLDPAGLLKRCFSVWTKGWPCMRCWEPWKSQEFEGAHLCPTPLTTVPPYSCSSLRAIGPWDFGDGPLDLERIKRISEMISLI